MTPETLEALKGSIEKWRKIVEEGDEDRGHRDCPLCDLFWRIDNRDCCGCPIRNSTNQPNCIDSPYERWAELEGLYNAADTPEKMEAARAELEFLRSLLPKEEGE